jgi:hypothetical protein
MAAYSPYGSTWTRNAGSGFSTFYWSNQIIAFLDELRDSGQKPIAQYQAVTPLGMSYPAEIALPRVRSEGTLQITLRELWNQPAWWALGQAAAGPASPNTASGGPFVNTYNIIEVYNALAQSQTPITCTTVIQIPSPSATPDPTLPAGPNPSYRGWTYHGVTLTDIDDSETIQIGTITMPRQLTAVYTYKTYFSGQSLGSAQQGSANNPGQGAFTY